MIDVVGLFKEKAELLSADITFDYGTKAMTNLLRSNTITQEVFFLLSSPTTWKRLPAKYGLGKSSVSGSFLLSVKSNLDNVIFKQKNADENNTKYIRNIKPLLDRLEAFEKSFLCDEKHNFKLITAVDGYNMLDTNVDGLIIAYECTEI